ncbi:Staphylolytic protease preproenzyme LasA [hydrothermal vent metagenome]|uniref:Staphylolytic protease preproenzyme LasA n=1 Tax=hydrothermal vent metagenome TaxID=652676 RepID=A0A1W1CQY2_9ZZZZ
MHEIEPVIDIQLTTEELNDLQRAKQILENPGFAMKVAGYIGKPIEFAIDKIDSETLNQATSKALGKALDIAIGSLNEENGTSPSNLKHKMLAGGSGAVGGFFGLSALAIELPVSTTIMLRSIADVAQSQQHDLNELETRLACLEVFSLGSTRNSDDDAGESAYFAARATLAFEMRAALQSVSHMSSQAIQDALAKGQMPILIKFINTIASRFGIVVSEKMAAQTIPLVGAAGGAAINLMFIDHFQDMAEGHFTVKRLEKKYGREKIEALYKSLVLQG